MKYLILVALILTAGAFAEDYEYNTGGSMEFVSDMQGSSTGWGEWFAVTLLNDTGHDLVITEFGFPCCGDATDTLGWIVYTNVGGANPPAGDPSTCDFNGPFTPVEPAGGDPSVYTYVDVTADNVLIPSGNYWCFGYDNTDLGGQTAFNGVETWSWYDTGSGFVWDTDSSWGRTGILQVKANYAAALESATWGSIKSTF